MNHELTNYVKRTYLHQPNTRGVDKKTAIVVVESHSVLHSKKLVYLKLDITSTLCQILELKTVISKAT